MKELFTTLVIILVILPACKSDPDYGEIGKTGPGGGTIFFAEGGQYMECSGELGNSTWDTAVTTAKNYKGGDFTNWHLPTRSELDLMYKNLKENGLGGFSDNWYWSLGEGYCQDFSNGHQRIYSISNTFCVRAVRAYSKDDDASTTTLKINNQSFTEITNVIWNNVIFAENQVENSIKSGKNVTKNVQAGSGYIFFKRKSNPITARTRDVVIIEAGKSIEFIFSDNTIITEVNNTANTGTLSALQSTVVWWDDAEGDYLPYAQRTNVTYSTLSPRYGQKCIAFAQNGDLTFNISLEKNAKISFWHRTGNVISNNTSSQPVMNINNIEKKKWTANNDWSFFESLVDEGNTIIQFKSTAAYLYLDDILIYYME